MEGAEHRPGYQQTHIKRKAIRDALSQLSKIRKSEYWFMRERGLEPYYRNMLPNTEARCVNHSGMHVAGGHCKGPSSATQAHNIILNLPGEIRNRIYIYTLGIEHVKQCIPRGSSAPVIRDPAFGLLQLCRQITAEARSMLEANATAYIPVFGETAFEKIVQAATEHGSDPATDYGLDLVSAASLTVVSALATFVRVHIHLHTTWAVIDGRTQINPSSAHLYGRLRQALLIFTINSSAIVEYRKVRKRRAVVHLDHLLSDWDFMAPLIGPYRFVHLVDIMGRDTCTDWELRYYVRTESPWEVWDSFPRDADDFAQRELDAGLVVCSRYDNVKMVAEVYGANKWSQEGRAEVSREITPSSVLWQNWPHENVPWRRQHE